MRWGEFVHSSTWRRQICLQVRLLTISKGLKTERFNHSEKNDIENHQSIGKLWITLASNTERLAGPLVKNIDSSYTFDCAEIWRSRKQRPLWGGNVQICFGKKCICEHISICLTIKELKILYYFFISRRKSLRGQKEGDRLIWPLDLLISSSTVLSQGQPSLTPV